MLACSPPFHFILHEKNFGQTIWDKCEVLLGTSWGNNLGSLWEPHVTTLGTRNPNLLPPPNSFSIKKRKLDPSWVHDEASYWLHETFIISKTVCHHFWPGLMAGAQTLGHREAYRQNRSEWNPPTTPSQRPIVGTWQFTQPSSLLTLANILFSYPPKACSIRHHRFVTTNHNPTAPKIPAPLFPQMKHNCSAHRIHQSGCAKDVE